MLYVVLISLCREKVNYFFSDTCPFYMSVQGAEILRFLLLFLKPTKTTPELRKICSTEHAFYSSGITPRNTIFTKKYKPFFEESPQILRHNLRACSENNSSVAVDFSLVRPLTQRGYKLFTQLWVSLCLCIGLPRSAI